MELITAVIGLLILLAFFVAVARLGDIARHAKKISTILHVSNEAQILEFLDKQEALARDADKDGDARTAKNIRAGAERIKRNILI